MLCVRVGLYSVRMCVFVVNVFKGTVDSIDRSKGYIRLRTAVRISRRVLLFGRPVQYYNSSYCCSTYRTKTDRSTPGCMHRCVQKPQDIWRQAKQGECIRIALSMG